MFGYVSADKKSLTPEQEARFKAAYCGLCDALKARHGAFARFALSFDMTFLTLLLDSLYEPETKRCEARCAMHPFCKRRHEASEFTDYAADMTIALFYHKCLDDWRDEKKLLRRAEASLIKKRYDAVAQLYPKQCAVMEASLARLQEIEHDENAAADSAADAFGAITAALFAPRADMWEARLRAFGMALGRFIYMMDAWDDCKKDARRGNFNSFAADLALPDFNERCRAVLEMLMAQCAAEFEGLPLEADIDLMRNVIYSGVWTRFYLKRAYERGRTDADNRSV